MSVELQVSQLHKLEVSFEVDSDVDSEGEPADDPSKADYDAKEGLADDPSEADYDVEGDLPLPIIAHERGINRHEDPPKVDYEFIPVTNRRTLESTLATIPFTDLKHIADWNINKHRVIALVECVEYGQVHGQPGALVIFGFTFQTFRAHFRDARICATLDGPNAPTFEHLEPVSLISDLSETTVKTSIQGGATLGLSSVGVNATASHETESTRKHRWHIQSSGRGTTRAVWTLQEDNVTGNRNGLPDYLPVAMVFQTEGEFTISLSITATINLFDDIRDSIGKRIKNRGGIPKLRFDGETEYGGRPSEPVIAESVFVKAPAN